MEIRTKKEERKEKGVWEEGGQMSTVHSTSLSLFNGARGSKEKDN